MDLSRLRDRLNFDVGRPFLARGNNPVSTNYLAPTARHKVRYPKLGVAGVAQDKDLAYYFAVVNVAEVETGERRHGSRRRLRVICATRVRDGDSRHRDYQCQRQAENQDWRSTLSPKSKHFSSSEFSW